MNPISPSVVWNPPKPSSAGYSVVSSELADPNAVVKAAIMSLTPTPKSKGPMPSPRRVKTIGAGTVVGGTVGAAVGAGMVLSGAPVVVGAEVVTPVPLELLLLLQAASIATLAITLVTRKVMVRLMVDSFSPESRYGNNGA